MAKILVNEDDVKKALGIKSFRNLSKNKIREFVSSIPYIDKEVAVKIIEQFPTFTDSAKGMFEQFKSLTSEALKSNDESQKEALAAYKQILDSLDDGLDEETLTHEERTQIFEQMIKVADRVAVKDTENKEFLSNQVRHAVSLMGGVMVLGAMLLGGNIRDFDIPKFKK